MTYNLIQEKAFTLGINDIYLLSTIIALIGLPLSFMLKKEDNTKELSSKDIVA